MKHVRPAKSYVLSIILGVAVVVAAAEVTWWMLGRAREQKADRQLTGLRHELIALQHAAAPTASSASAMLADQVTQATAALQTVEHFWSRSSRVQAWTQTAVPQDRRAAYFDLAHFRQRTATLAEREHVKIAENEAFGFGAYRNEGPTEGEVARVHRLRLVLEDVLTLLFRAHPSALQGVACETGAATDRPRVTQDAEAIPPWPTMLSTRHAGVVRAQALEIRFTGRTTVLRDWLNALVASDLPVVVRTISVQPSKPTSIPAPKPANGLVLDAADDGFRPLVRPVESEFVVGLEYIELVTADVGHGGGT